jgi:hypothetical protein
MSAFRRGADVFSAHSNVSPLPLVQHRRSPQKRSPATGRREERRGLDLLYRLFRNTDEQGAGQCTIFANKRCVARFVAVTENSSCSSI